MGAQGVEPVIAAQRRWPGLPPVTEDVTEQHPLALAGTGESCRVARERQREPAQITEQDLAAALPGRDHDGRVAMLIGDLIEGLGRAPGRLAAETPPTVTTLRGPCRGAGGPAGEHSPQATSWLRRSRR